MPTPDTGAARSPPQERGLPPVAPLAPFKEGEAHNMACISQHGLYRRPSNESIVVHFLKTPGAMQYVRAVLARGRRGEDAHKRTCCTRMVWPTERRRFPASVCDGVMPPGVDGDGVTVEDGWSGKEG